MSSQLPDDHLLRSAKWIWPLQYHLTHNAYACFRKDFELTTLPAQAPLHITADQQYMLYVNGQFAGRGPARGYQSHWPFDTIDIAPLLVRGHNWISVIAYNPGVGTFQYHYQNRAGFLCAGQWGDFQLLSNESWCVRMSQAHRRHTAKLSMQLCFAEQFDARLDDHQWIYNTTPPAKEWSEPYVKYVFGSMPWHDVEPRGLPNLTGNLVDYQSVCATATGNNSDGWQTWENLKESWLPERKNTTWTKTNSSTHRDPTSLIIPAAGEGNFHAIVLDLGRVNIGTFVIQAQHALGGEVLDLFACEWLDDDGGPHVHAPHLACWVALMSRFTLRAGTTHLESMQMIGHRYLTLIVRDSTSPIHLNIKLRESVYPLDIAGKFACGDETLNDIHRLCVNTQRICALDSYVDTPWREQAQWWGDSRVQAWNTFHLTPDTRLLERGIKQISEQRTPNGLTYGHAPTIAHECILPDFSLIWCLTLFDHYWQTGDANLFSQQWPGVLSILHYFDTEGCGKDGLVQNDPRYWLFLDWTNINHEGTPTLVNLWYYHTLDKLAELAQITNNHQALSELTTRRDRLKNKIIERLFDHEANLFHDGYLADGSRVNHYTIHNQTLAILSGLLPHAHENMVQKILLPYLSNDMPADRCPSAYWVTYVYSVMRALGYDEIVIAHIKRYWSLMIPFGCTETFAINPTTHRPNDNDGGSMSHAWSAHPIFHLMGSLGGITQTAPAWKRINYRPTFAFSDHCQTIIPTPSGLIHSNWKREKNSVTVTLELPHGIEATISLPGISEQKAHGVNTWTLLPSR